DNYLYLTCTSPAMPADIYDVTVTLDTFGRVLEADGVVTYSGTPPINTITTMQTLTADACKTAPFADTAGNNIYTLKDSRDNKSYKIAHLADGNCWMVQNLALDGGRTLTPADSNVTSDVALPANKSSGDSSSYSEMQVFNKLSGYDGNYYNWCSAITISNCYGTTTKVSTSICPKNWQLPNGSNDNPSYNILFDASRINNLDTNNEKIAAIEGLPYSFSAAGTYAKWGGTTTYVGQGQYGTYWTNTGGGESSPHLAMCFTYFKDGSYFLPFNAYGKFLASSVRCVFGS
ncbi:hypothetical protein IKG54_01665, partial [Candidatus Saccharibacteria bacterium]|nr:hypothetical protein [Candidatus Saccharibacteria bacterium]